MAIEIRKAAQDDILDIMERRIAFVFEVTGRTTPQKLRETTIEYLKNHINSDSLVCYVAAEDHKIISLVILCVYQVIPKLRNSTGKVGYVFNVYTLQEYRGRGLATELMARAIETAQRMDVKEIYLIGEEKAIPLYERLGFRFVDREMVLNLE
ncbi:MAG: GNAT family N-acetyltransferase [Syntrophomonas sp.]|nr:GNAT family N-acetyltransferase [Syntrophomonas sp.]